MTTAQDATVSYRSGVPPCRRADWIPASPLKGLFERAQRLRNPALAEAVQLLRQPRISTASTISWLRPGPTGHRKSNPANCPAYTEGAHSTDRRSTVARPNASWPWSPQVRPAHHQWIRASALPARPIPPRGPHSARDQSSPACRSGTSRPCADGRQGRARSPTVGTRRVRVHVRTVHRRCRTNGSPAAPRGTVPRASPGSVAYAF